jgi:5'-3' exonuclease
MNINKKKIFLHIDGANLFHRQIRMTNPALGIDSAIGMALHLILYSMKKEWTTFKADHAVFYLEGHSWRKKVYPAYKANRAEIYDAMTEKEQENREILTGAYDDLVDFIDQQTNITVLRNPNTEADDMIAVFIEAHPEDTHILISSDSDFYQLLKLPNLTIYDPIKDIRITRDGIHDDNGKRLEFKIDSTAKIKVGKPNPTFVCDPDWYNYALFLKCIRGDKTDNIFSAYPGVREKGTKTAVGIREAYNDNNKGYNWNNFMLQKWIDHNEKEHIVKDKYNLNRLLIDLSQIPDNIKEECLIVIAETTGRKNVASVDIGIFFMKFCGRWALTKIGNNAQQFMPLLKSKYETT